MKKHALKNSPNVRSIRSKNHGVESTSSGITLPAHRTITSIATEEPQWTDIIPAGQWANYRLAIESARNAGIPFLLGGGFGLAVYAGRWRNTKDIDLYIQPRDREAMIAALSNIGFVDYYDQKPYDPGWIYRSTKDSIIVDVIWSMGNRRAEVDELWFEHAPSVLIREESLQMVPMEELLWCKLYIMQRDHCDWTDAFNLIHANITTMDWDRVLERLGEDWPLLQGILTVYTWMCPGHAANLPASLRRKLHLPTVDANAAQCREDRIKLLDSRAWFAAFQPKDKILEV